MCLAVRGRILTISEQPPAAGPDEAAADDGLWRMAEVDFGGVRHWVSLACLPAARVGDRVLVHVGLAIALVDDDGDEDQAPDAVATAVPPEPERDRAEAG